MKILHVLTSPRAEGTPRIVLDWLSNTEHEQVVLFLKAEPNDLLNDFEKTNKEIYFNHKPYSRLISRIIEIPKAVKKICKKIHPDIVIAWNQPNIHLILLGAKIAGIPYLLGHAGCLPEKNKKTGWLYTYFVFYVTRMLKGIIVCPSDHIYTTFCAIPFFPKKTIRKINNAINISRFISEDSISRVNAIPKTAIVVGNIEDAKDHNSLIRIWELVVKKEPEAHLFIIGGGSKEAELKKHIELSNLQKNIQMTGPKNNVPELLNKSHLFVFTSKNVEGFGTVLIEALAAGLEIIAFDEPAAREVLSNGEYGKLIEGRNIEKFADAVVDSLNKQNDSKKNIAKTKYAESFSVKKMVDSYIEIFE